MSELLFHYSKVNPTTWAYLSSLLMIGLFFKFSRFWSVRNVDLFLLVLLSPGLLLTYFGDDAVLEAWRTRQAAQQAIDELKAPITPTLSAAPVELGSNRSAASIPSPVNLSPPASPQPTSAAPEDGEAPVPRHPGEIGMAELRLTEAEAALLEKREILRLGYLWLLAVSAIVLARLLLDTTWSRRPLLEPNLSTGGLIFLGCSLFVFLMANVITSVPTADDIKGARGATRLLQRESLTPEDDTLVRHGPGYAVMNLLPSVPTMSIMGRPRTASEGVNLHAIIAKVMAIVSHLAIVIGIVAVGYQHFDNLKMGIGAATLYLMLPYTAVMTGRVDHVLPGALLIGAIVFYRRPLLSGIFIGLATGVVYYPIFLLPLWISFYWPRGLRGFLSGLVISLSLMALSLALVSSDSTEFVMNVKKMFGLWLPLREGLNGIWGLGWDPNYRLPVLAAFCVLSCSLAIWPAQKNLGTLLSCSSAVMVATQFWHGQGGGIYMAWYLPLTLLTIFRPNLEDRVALTVLSESWFLRRLRAMLVPNSLLWLLAMLGLGTLLVSSLARTMAWSTETPPTETAPAEKTPAEKTPAEKTPAKALSREQLDWFERELRPLLTAQCLGCHGPKKQEGGLRLDHTQSLHRGGDRGPAIAPETLDESLILQAVRRTGDLKMPPDRPLTAAQIKTLETWLKLGAYWPATVASSPGGSSTTRGGPITEAERRWWSLQPLARPTVPALATNGQVASWDSCEFSPRTSIDPFVAAGWQAAQLQPVRLTDRRTWLRRATVDLTGLPPTVEQLREFAGDESPDAAARVIDRLLASPAYGERYGRHWLDVVRYADTAGDGADYPVREAYRYRDYVVRSFNRDKPYDQFLREQVAGDLLPVPSEVTGTSATRETAAAAPTAVAVAAAEFPESSLERYRDQVTATGFLAVSKRFGYNLNNEFQHLDLADALEGLGRSVLGLSLGCARCHDHKYDPISAADYYAWYGILQSSQFTFPGGEELKQPRNLVPLLPPALVTARQQAQQLKLGQLDLQLAERQQQLQTAAARLPLDPSLFGFENQTLNQPPGKPWFQAGPNQILAVASSPFTHLFTGSTRGARIGSGKPNDGLRLEFPPARKAANSPQLYVNIDFRSVIETTGNSAAETAAPAAIDAATYPGSFRMFLSQGVIASMGLEFSVAANELMVKENQEWQRLRPLQPNTWYSLQVTIDMARKTYSGRVGREGDWSEWTDRKMSAGWNGEIDTLISDGLGHRPGAVLPRDLDNIAYQSTPFVSPQLDLPTAELQARRQAVTELETQIQQLRQQKNQLASEPLYDLAYGVTEGQPQDTRIQKRGEPDRLGEVVPRRNLEILGGEPLRQPQAGSGRLDLAQWLTSPANPLTARVLVNRLWQWHFGTGIVATASDFGTRGELPSHPELLDYLAQELLRQEWSMKGLHRELMLSAVYALSDTVVERNQEQDPKNRLLTRFTRRPLDAESIRDSQLMISGELDRRWPGAHPFPPVSQWNFTIHYPFTADYESAHRSLYLMVQRQRKHPYLSLFDGADPNISTSERLTTITPTQALYLLNSPFVHAQSAALARRLLREHADDDSRLRWVWEATTGREVPAEELAAARQFLAEYQQPSGSQPGEAQANQSPAELEGAWAALARVLLTSNGLLFVD